ncbi:MAG: alpha/beta fold hydrolase, partial [Gammaproteobacteria bacterium]|nr:alpha/beta fold hydrolase [Gammaproteobacteria bacterium]
LTSSPQLVVPQQIAVICHPHPQHGGTMHNKVVTTLHRTYQDLGMLTVRFNYRGVGNSEGKYDQGRGESDDLLTVLKWVHKTCPQHQLYLAGFSFGAWISYHIAGQYHQPVKHLVTVAPPIHYDGFAQLPQPPCPWLVVQGEQDEVVNAQDVYDWLAEMAQPPLLIRMPNTGHFFHGKLVTLREQLKDSLLS